MSLLEINAIDAYYGESHVIRSLSISVEGDEICVLPDRNDAGKITMFRRIVGVTSPEVREDIIWFKDDDITGVPTEDVSIQGIPLVPEGQHTSPNLFVTEDLHLAETVNNKLNTFGRSLSFGHKRISTEEVCDQFLRLDERRDQRAGTLSGDGQQMFAIARVPKQNTDLLLLNEPYEGLAPKVTEDAEDAVERISDAGTIILPVEQNVVAAIELADRVYVVDQGGIVSDGIAEEFRDDNETREWYLGV